MKADVLSLECDLWSAAVAEHAELPDERLNQRLADILSILVRKSHDSIPQACPSPAATKATYRFFANHRVTAASLRQTIAAATVEQCRGRSAVLVIHDTTSLNYTAHTGTEGLGRLGSSDTAQGLYLHTSLALRDDGVALGMVHQECWSRSAERPQRDRYHRPIAEKESHKWLRSVHGATAAFAPVAAAERPRLIHVMDREGDIHEVLETIAGTTDGAVIRCARNRVLDESMHRAHAAVAAAPLLGVHTIDVRAQSGRSPRTARLQVRAMNVTIQPAHKHPNQKNRRPIPMQLVEVREVDAPADATPLHWRLWTTEPVNNFHDAIAIVVIYQRRWPIEDFHLTLKSGCQIEKLELETADRLIKAITVYSAVAVHLLTLRDLARREPNAPCTTILSDDAWKALWLHIHKKRLTANVTVPTIRQAVLWIGRLGGHLNRQRDGMPGVRTLWRGYRDLNLLVLGYRLACNPA